MMYTTVNTHLFYKQMGFPSNDLLWRTVKIRMQLPRYRWNSRTRWTPNQRSKNISTIIQRMISHFCSFICNLESPFGKFFYLLQTPMDIYTPNAHFYFISGIVNTFKALLRRVVTPKTKLFMTMQGQTLNPSSIIE